MTEERTKKRKPPEDTEDNSELWLVSYADMMTLIACFFILMMAFANYDPAGFTQKTKEIARHFNKDKYKSSDTKMRFLQEEIARHPELKKMTKISVIDDELVISFSGSALFESGQYTFKDEVIPVLDGMIDIIKTQNSQYNIIVEGHSDNQPMGSSSPFTSNWALSGARAASVVERFEFFGFSPKNLKALGLGSSKPLAPNEDENGIPILENLKVNRRVVIKVIEPLDPSKTVKMGLGVYFDNAPKY